MKLVCVTPKYNEFDVQEWIQFKALYICTYECIHTHTHTIGHDFNNALYCVLEMFCNCNNTKLSCIWYQVILMKASHLISIISCFLCDYLNPQLLVCI